jgi:hypothetical protein
MQILIDELKTNLMLRTITISQPLFEILSTADYILMYRNVGWAKISLKKKHRKPETFSFQKFFAMSGQNFVCFVAGTRF